MRLHEHDTSWPPVLVFCALVVVFGGVFAAVLFMRRVRQSLRSGSGSRRDDAERTASSTRSGVLAGDAIGDRRRPRSRSKPPSGRAARGRVGSAGSVTDRPSASPSPRSTARSTSSSGRAASSARTRSLSAGVMPGHVIDHSPVVTIGDRVLIGKGSGDRRAPLGGDRRRRVHRPSRLHHRRQPRLRGRHAPDRQAVRGAASGAHRRGHVARPRHRRAPGRRHRPPRRGRRRIGGHRRAAGLLRRRRQPGAGDPPLRRGPRVGEGGLLGRRRCRSDGVKTGLRPGTPRATGSSAAGRPAGAW